MNANKLCRRRKAMSNVAEGGKVEDVTKDDEAEEVTVEVMKVVSACGKKCAKENMN